MKLKIKLLLTLFLAMPSLAQVIDTKQYSDPALKEGECHTLSDSKVYLSSVKKNSKAVSEIGEAKIDFLRDTESESYFFCKLKCVLNTETHYIWITQKDENENFKKLEGFVCSGLEIRDVAVTSTLTIKTTVATPYKAVQSSFSEVHDVLKSINYKMTSQMTADLFSEFYLNLHAVQKAYSTASSGPFLLAGAELAQYFLENPESEQLIKDKMAELATIEALEGPAHPTTMDFTSSASLVNLFFRMNGRFVPYVPEKKQAEQY